MLMPTKHRRSVRASRKYTLTEDYQVTSPTDHHRMQSAHQSEVPKKPSQVDCDTSAYPASYTHPASCRVAYLVQCSLEGKGADGQLVSGVADVLLIACELQQPLQAPELPPYLHIHLPHISRHQQ